MTPPWRVDTSGAGRLAIARQGMSKFLSSRRKSPVVFDPTRDNGPNYAVDVTGGGRSSDQPQDVGEQVSRNCDLRHLEGDVAGRFMDNIFIERLWRSIKYEEVHLKAYADGCEARSGISSWTNFYNFRRPHQAMNNQMPMAVWRAGMDKIEAAARAVDMPLRLDNANALPTYPSGRFEPRRIPAQYCGADRARRERLRRERLDRKSARDRRYRSPEHY